MTANCRRTRRTITRRRVHLKCYFSTTNIVTNFYYLQKAVAAALVDRVFRARRQDFIDRALGMHVSARQKRYSIFI